MEIIHFCCYVHLRPIWLMSSLKKKLLIDKKKTNKNKLQPIILSLRVLNQYEFDSTHEIIKNGKKRYNLRLVMIWPCHVFGITAITRFSWLKCILTCFIWSFTRHNSWSTILSKDKMLFQNQYSLVIKSNLKKIIN